MGSRDTMYPLNTCLRSFSIKTNSEQNGIRAYGHNSSTKLQNILRYINIYFIYKKIKSMINNLI